MTGLGPDDMIAAFMIFDLFHSISDPVIGGNQLGAPKVLQQFLGQATLAEALGFDTLWAAESHFSSEVQKQTSVATIPNFSGEVGLNADSYQLFHLIAAHTKTINLGTGIHNIVGGSGGPIASADRSNWLRFVNENYWGREIRLGVASGRFPYQNTPFGISPRDEFEQDFWPTISRQVFLEALEIYLRLLRGEKLASEQVRIYEIREEDLSFYGEKKIELAKKYKFPIKVRRRWEFESLQLVPQSESRKFGVVLGSSDPRAMEVGFPLWDLDLFNLSFTPPEKLNQLHDSMQAKCQKLNRQWHRSRLPRTVMVFVDKVSQKAHAKANEVIDTYIEAMRGTAMVPDKKVLLDRALVGDASEVREQLSPENPRGFQPEDRLMLWFEFNQADGDAICQQMKYFAENVAATL